MGFLNTMFETKIETKYFLTIIGDCILKKNTCDTNSTPLLFFINANTKKLISYIDSIAYITTGNSIMGNFISKYHESHNLSVYRLIKTNDNTISSELIREVLNKIGIDLLCVSAHYSERYNKSDQFLINSDDPIKKYIMYFSLNNIDTIINDFISQCIEKTNTTNSTNNSSIVNTYNLSWNNIHYIWKLYLSSMNIPNMILKNNLKTMLKEQLPHTSICVVGSLDPVFTNVTSKYLPNVSNFLAFWEKHITISSSDFDNEYEIDEISSLYKLTNKNSNISLNVSDKEIIKMICHYFYPNVEVIENKYITNIHCNLWSKHDDIWEMLDNYKKQQKLDELTLISFDDLYQSYKSYFQAKNVIEKTFCPIVSKHFFEKFLSHYLFDFIKFDKFVSSEWLQI